MDERYFQRFSSLLILHAFLVVNPAIEQYEGDPLPESPREKAWRDEMAELYKRPRQPKRAETLIFQLIEKYLNCDCELLDMVKRMEDKDPRHYYDIYNKYKDVTDITELPEDIKIELENLFKLPKENEVLPRREHWDKKEKVDQNERIKTREDLKKYDRQSYWTPRVCAPNNEDIYPFVVQLGHKELEYGENEYHVQPGYWIARMIRGASSESYNGLLYFYFEKRMSSFFNYRDFHKQLIKYLDAYWAGIEMLQNLVDDKIPIKKYEFDTNNFPIVFIIDQPNEKFVKGQYGSYYCKEDKIKVGVDVTCWATDTLENKEILDQYAKKNGLTMRSMLFKDISAYIDDLRTNDEKYKTMPKYEHHIVINMKI